jgi:C_GCAxxG_C_C family probable redox protein
VLTEKQILQQFQNGYDCVQIIWLVYAPALELSEDEAMEYASASGTGVFRRKICGALDGAAAVLKMFYGYSPFDEYESDPCVDEKLHELKMRFADINGALTCSALLGTDLTVAENADFSATDSISLIHCSKYVASALSLIDDIVGRDF